MVLKHNPKVNKVFDILGIVGNARCTNPKETKEKHTTQHNTSKDGISGVRMDQNPPEENFENFIFFKYLHSGSFNF